MTPKKARTLNLILGAVAIVSAMAWYLLQDTGSVAAIAFGAVTVVSLVAEMAVRLLYWKCPSCDAHLPNKGTLFITHCPYCGAELDDE